MLSPIDFPVDAVYTWVDGNDSNWKKKKTLHYIGLKKLLVHEFK